MNKRLARTVTGITRKLEEFDTERTLALDSTKVIRGTLVVYGFSVLMMALAHVLPSILTAPFVVLSLSFVPGTLLLLSLVRGRTAVEAEHVLYAFGGSLVVLMFVGALVNILLPLVGVTKPLMPIPLGAGVSLAVGLLAAVAYNQNPSGTLSVRVPPLWSPEFLGLLLLPLLSVVGVHLINTTGVNLLILLVLLAIGAVPLIALRRLSDQWYSLAAWTVSVAILYHKSLWQYAGFGGRPHGITAWEAGRWSPGVISIEQYSSELLQNGVLFPLFARLSDLFIITQYEVVNPFFVSFLPLALYVAFRRYARTDVAFLGAMVFAFAHPFYYQYPTAGRSATPVIFLALFGVALSNENLSAGSRALLAMMFLLGIVVTHYGTSYYVAAALAIALVILYLLRVIDEIAYGHFQQVAPMSDGGETVGMRPKSKYKIFTISTVTYFIVSSIGWYIYTRQGWKFDLLPKHIYDNLMTLIRGSGEGGRTAARVQETYTSVSIQVSKYLYILIAILIVVGLTVVYYRRLVRRESQFDDYYLTIGTALFGIFATTLVLSNWGGGRPMMISFSFTAVFAVIGALWIVNVGKRLSASANQYLPDTVSPAKLKAKISIDRSLGAYMFASLLLVFFVLNSGVAAATVFDESAPSNVPAQAALTESQSPQNQVTVHRGTDIATHIWMIIHFDERHAIYGDTFGARQFDWYRPSVAARTSSVGGGYTSDTKPKVISVSRQRSGTQPGYLLIMGHNVELDAVWPSKFNDPSTLRELNIDRRNRIYSTGESHVYFYPNSTESTTSEVDG